MTDSKEQDLCLICLGEFHNVLAEKMCQDFMSKAYSERVFCLKASLQEKTLTSSKLSKPFLSIEPSKVPSLLVPEPCSDLPSIHSVLMVLRAVKPHSYQTRASCSDPASVLRCPPCHLLFHWFQPSVLQKCSPKSPKKQSTGKETRFLNT